MALYEHYGEDGSLEREQCPRCGDTVLGEYGDRRHCGRCSYTEWQ